MSKMISLTYCGMDGHGSTVSLAKQDAARKIERALDGGYTPQVVRHRGVVTLVTRSPYGYQTAVITSPDFERPTGVSSLCCTHGYENEAEALKSAKMHAAHLGWVAEDGITPPAFITDRNEIADFQSWAAWQLAWLELNPKGATHEEISRRGYEIRNQLLCA